MDKSPKRGTKKKKLEKDKIDQEIIEIKEESLEPEKEQKEETFQETSEMPKKPKKGVRALVILVLILIVIDFLFFYWYFKPDFGSKISDWLKPKVTDETENSLNKNLKCSDGTPYESCSKNKPYYCYNGELLKKSATCGCPSGYKVDFQDCRKV